MKKEVLGVLIDMFCLSPVSSDVRWLDDAKHGGLCGLGGEVRVVFLPGEEPKCNLTTEAGQVY